VARHSLGPPSPVTLAGLVSAPLLAACSILTDYQPATNAAPEYSMINFGDLQLRGLLLVQSPNGRAVALVALVINDGPTVVLSKVTVRARHQDGRARSVTSMRTKPALRIPSEDVDAGALAQQSGVTRVGGDANPHLYLSDPEGRLRAGQFATVTLSFTRAGDTQVDVLVKEPKGRLAPYAPPATAGSRSHPE